MGSSSLEGLIYTLKSFDELGKEWDRVVGMGEVVEVVVAVEVVAGHNMVVVGIHKLVVAVEEVGDNMVGVVVEVAVVDMVGVELGR